MTLWNQYHLARSVNDALEALAAPGTARLIGGGTDLLLDLQQGRHPPVQTLIDVTAIPEMAALEIRGNSLYIGAAVPLNRVVADPAVSQHAEALYEAAGLIGGPQVRNTATLGGNVAHALPAADGTIALLALDAEAEIASLQGRIRKPLRELFQGPGRSALDPRLELLVGFYLPLSAPGQGSAFRRVMRPQGVAIAILNLAAWVQRTEDRVQDIRLSIGPAGPTPLRLCGAENVLRGQRLDEQSLDQAAQALIEEAHFRTSPHRSTAEYRRHMARILLEQTLAAAFQRAGAAG